MTHDEDDEEDEEEDIHTQCAADALQYISAEPTHYLLLRFPNGSVGSGSWSTGLFVFCSAALYCSRGSFAHAQ